MKYTCVSVNNKLVWNAGVKVTPPTTTTTSGLPTNNFDTKPAGSLLWSETFTGAAGAPVDSTIWSPVTGYGTYGTGEIENNTTSSANLAQDGSGNLAITATCHTGCGTSTMGTTWTSARIWTLNKLNFQYGQLEARIWMPAGKFNWPAFWMMGQDYTNPLTPWPICGELDIAEGLVNNQQDQATLHSNVPGTNTDWAFGQGLTQIAPLKNISAGFHTYGILWKPNYIAFILDGKVWASDAYNSSTGVVTQTVGQYSQPFHGGTWPFNQKFFIILNDAIPGGTTAPNGSTATMKINWIKYYKYNGLGAVTK